MKVFGVGLPKTGTLSLAAATHRLGMKTTHNPRTPDMVRSHDVILDLPSSALYKQHDVTHPGSKFILTTRDRETWLRSCESWWKVVPGTFLSVAVFGQDLFDRDVFLSVHERWDEGVRWYFKDRPDDLLELPLELDGATKWSLLCGFLNKQVPDEPFPHLHQQRYGGRSVAKLKVDLGCGHPRRKGYEDWLGVDLHQPNHPDIHADIRQRIPGLEDGCACDVACNHVMEHLAPDQWLDVMQEMSRLLCKGGRFVIRVPHPSHDSAMILGHVHVMTPRFWTEARELGWPPKDLVIDFITEVPCQYALDFCQDHGLDFGTWSFYLRNSFLETVVEGHKR